MLADIIQIGEAQSLKKKAGKVINNVYDDNSDKLDESDSLPCLKKPLPKQ